MIRLMLLLVMGVLCVVPFARIFTRLGFGAWLSLLMLIPVVNILVLYIVAFSPTNATINAQPATTRLVGGFCTKCGNKFGPNFACCGLCGVKRSRA